MRGAGGERRAEPASGKGESDFRLGERAGGVASSAGRAEIGVRPCGEAGGGLQPAVCCRDVPGDSPFPLVPALSFKRDNSLNNNNNKKKKEIICRHLSLNLSAMVFGVENRKRAFPEGPVQAAPAFTQHSAQCRA